jgi:hypothetical protein
LLIAVASMRAAAAGTISQAKKNVANTHLIISHLQRKPAEQ